MTFCVAHGLSKEEAIRRIVNRAATTITSDPDRLDAFERGIRLQPEPVELVEGVALLGVQLDPELPE
jgi:hypothetical protein